MRRSLVAFFVLAVVFATTVSAGAAPPKCTDPSLPGCGGDTGPVADPDVGTSCMEADGFNFVTEERGDFYFTLTGGSVNACIDVSDVEAGDWEIDVEVAEGTLRNLYMKPFDSWAPGDFCGDEWKYRKNVGLGSPIVLEGISGDYVNACGVEYGEVVDGVYYGTAEPNIPSPLAFMVYTRGSSDLKVDFSVNVAPLKP